MTVWNTVDAPPTLRRERAPQSGIQYDRTSADRSTGRRADRRPGGLRRFRSAAVAVAATAERLRCDHQRRDRVRRRPCIPASAASVRRITYVSRSAIYDTTTHVTGSVHVPTGTAPQGGYHVVAYGPAVSGTAPDCARSPEVAARSSAAIEAPAEGGLRGRGDRLRGGWGSRPAAARPFHPVLDSTTAGYNLIDARTWFRHLPDLGGRRRHQAVRLRGR